MAKKQGVFAGWGGRIRTSVSRNQNPLPYHLATPQRQAGNLSRNRVFDNKGSGRGPPIGLGGGESAACALGRCAVGKECKACGAAAAHPGEKRSWKLPESGQCFADLGNELNRRFGQVVAPLRQQLRE